MWRYLLVCLTCLSPCVLANECAPARDPSRIVTAGGSLTEILYYLGEESRIVAVDTTSNFPAAASDLPSIGYVRALSAEGLLSLNPTLILGEDDMGPREVVEQVKRSGLEVVRVPEVQTAQGIVDKVICIANILSMDDTEGVKAAKRSVTRLRNIKTDARRVALLLGVRDGIPLAAGSGTSGDGFLAMAGANNIFEELEGWKPVSFESMVQANPEVIVISARGANQSGGLEKILKHPAIALTVAGNQGQIISLDGMSMLGFGPRTITTAIEFAEWLASDDLTITDDQVEGQ